MRNSKQTGHRLASTLCNIPGLAVFGAACLIFTQGCTHTHHSNANTATYRAPANQSARVDAPAIQPAPQPSVQARQVKRNSEPLVISFSEEENRQLQERARQREMERQAKEQEQWGRVLTNLERQEVREYGKPLTQEERLEYERLEIERLNARKAAAFKREELQIERERIETNAELERERLDVERERIENRRDFFYDDRIIYYDQPVVVPQKKVEQPAPDDETPQSKPVRGVVHTK